MSRSLHHLHSPQWDEASCLFSWSYYRSVKCDAIPNLPKCTWDAVIWFGKWKMNIFPTPFKTLIWMLFFRLSLNDTKELNLASCFVPPCILKLLMKVLKNFKEINVSLLNILVSINQHFPIENLSAYSYFIFDQCYISEKCILQSSPRNRWITVLAQPHSSIRFIFCIWQCSREVIEESITRGTGWSFLLWVDFLSSLFLTAMTQLKLREQSHGVHDPGLSDFSYLLPLEGHSHSFTSLFKYNWFTPTCAEGHAWMSWAPHQVTPGCPETLTPQITFPSLLPWDCHDLSFPTGRRQKGSSLPLDGAAGSLSRCLVVCHWENVTACHQLQAGD